VKTIPVLLATLMLTAWSGTLAAQDQGSAADLYRRSYAAESKGDYDEALDLMKRVHVPRSGGYVLHLRTGWLLYLNGKHAQAVVEYRKASRLKPAAIEPLLGVMLPLMAERKWKEAMRVGLAVLEKAPADFTAQSRIAYIRYQQGRYPEAEKWYRKALEGYPSNVEMRTGLGWSLLRQNRFKEAEHEFRSVLNVAPDHASSQEGISRIP